MTRLIDADALLETEKPKGISDEVWRESSFYKAVSNAPTVEAKPIHHSTRTDENGVKWILGEHGWERKDNA